MSIRIPAFWESQLAVLLKELGSLLSCRVYKSSCLAETFSKALLYCYTSCTPFVQPDLGYLEQVKGYNPASHEK